MPTTMPAAAVETPYAETRQMSVESGAPSSVYVEFFPVRYGYTKMSSTISQTGFADIKTTNVSKVVNTNLTGLAVHLHPREWNSWFAAFGATSYGGIGTYTFEVGRTFDQLSTGIRVGLDSTTEDDTVSIPFERQDAPYKWNSELKTEDTYSIGFLLSYNLAIGTNQTLVPRFAYQHYTNETTAGEDDVRTTKMKLNQFVLGSAYWYTVNSLVDVGAAVDVRYGSGESELKDVDGDAEEKLKRKTVVNAFTVQIFQGRLKF